MTPSTDPDRRHYRIRLFRGAARLGDLSQRFPPPYRIVLDTR